MDLKEIAEAYQLVYEKKKLDPVGKEDDDVDNDGDVDSSDEYLRNVVLPLVRQWVRMVMTKMMMKMETQKV